MNFGRTRRLSNSYDSALLPTNDTFFTFDDTNSDLARQLFLRAKAGGSALRFTNLVVPETVNERLDGRKLKWDELSGIAQRALLWDSGFGVARDNKVVKIWTLGGHSMTDLAVPLTQFKYVGCTERNCTQPDKTVSLSNLWCNGEQMLTAARCVIEDFEEGDEMHLAMWMTGGNPNVIPTPRIIKYAWKEKSTNISYTVLAVHTVNMEDEAAYDACPSKNQNSGYGSLVLPCYTNANISEGVRDAMEEVQGTPWVSRWLKEDFSGASKSAATTSTDDNDGLKMVLIAPIMAGILVVVGVVAIYVYIKRKRQRNVQSDALEDSLIYMETFHSRSFREDQIRDNDYTPDGSRPLSFCRVPAPRVILVPGRITLYRFFSGACGEVWLGEYQSQQVAIKRLLQAKAHRTDEVEAFAREIELSASLVHPNVASFIGVAWNSLNNLVMALEYFPTGDLQAYLAKNADLMSWPKDKIGIAVGVGRAHEYLHSRSPPLIHRDLKSKNILLTCKLEAKLIDFGVSRDRQEFPMTAGVGTPYWTAPEILEGKQYTEQADIYSFGVVLSELDTGKIPHHDALTSEGKKPKSFQILTDVMAGMLRPSFSDTCPSRIRRIGVRCCQQDPSRRPTPAQVANMLEEAD